MSLPGELVLAVRQRHRDVPGGPPVQLRRPAGTGARPSAQPRVVGVEQALAFQLVQMKLGLMQRDLERDSRLFAAHRAGLRAHELIQPAPRRVGQRPDPRRVSIGERHRSSSNGQKY